MSSRYVPCEKCGEEVGQYWHDGEWDRITHSRTGDYACDPLAIKYTELRTLTRELAEALREYSRDPLYGDESYKSNCVLCCRTEDHEPDCGINAALQRAREAGVL
jgi:hypothetical protein